MGRVEVEPGQERVNPKEFWYYFLPAGRIFEWRSDLSRDPETVLGLERARDSLDSCGLLVLDAHLRGMDIVMTGIALSKELEIRTLVAAVSAYDFYYPQPQKSFFTKAGRLPGVEFYPVYRDDDVLYDKRRMAHEQAGAEERRRANWHYIRRAAKVVREPGGVVLVAPYNGVNRMGKNLASGVELLLRRGCPGICTFPVFEPYQLKFHTFISKDLIEFPHGTRVDAMHAQILFQHQALLERAREAGLNTTDPGGD